MFGLLGFYGISTIVGSLKSSLYIYDLETQFVNNICKQLNSYKYDL